MKNTVEALRNTFWSELRNGFACVCLGALAILAIAAAMFVRDLPGLIREQSAITRDLMQTEMDGARKDAMARVDAFNASGLAQGAQAQPQ